MTGPSLLYAVREISGNSYDKHTRIYAITPDGLDRRLLFSDLGLPISILSKGGQGPTGEIIAAGANRVFAHAAPREKDREFIYMKAASIYELACDGSNAYRKVFDLCGDWPVIEIFISPSGEKLGYINYIGMRRFLFVHETREGKLLHRIDLRELFRDCHATSIGWTGERGKLFFTLHSFESRTEPASDMLVGSYVMKDDGSEFIKLDERFYSFHCISGLEGHVIEPSLVAVLADGRYVFRGGSNRGASASPPLYMLLYTVDARTGRREPLPIRHSNGINRFFKFSPDGRYTAFVEGNYHGEDENVWIKDLMTGAERIVYSRPEKELGVFHYFGTAGWYYGA